MMEIRQKQELEGYRPGMFAGRRKTGSLDGIRMTEEEVRRWKKSTDGMNNKDFIRNVKAEEEDKKKLEAQKFTTEPIDIADMYTMLMPAIPKSLEPGTTDKMVAQVLTPQFDVQAPVQMSEPREDVLCFEIRDSKKHVLDLAEEAVQDCLRTAGKYPYRIVLGYTRYLASETIIKATKGCYTTKDLQANIPYACADGVVDYDVMAVCEV